MTDIDSTIAALEAAEEGSRELDALFYRVLTGKQPVAYEGDWLEADCIHLVPHYTTNLQHAVDAIPEGWVWKVAGEWEWKRRKWESGGRRLAERAASVGLPAMTTAGDMGMPYAELYAPDYHKQPLGTAEYRRAWTSGIAPTPAIALCIAILRTHE